MSFGTPREVMPWTLGEDAAQPIFRQALDLGISFWDTANVYGAGTSEEIVGRAIKHLTTREAIVLATKLYWPMHPGPGGSGLSRKAILEQVDGSLRRLGTGYVDLLQIHRTSPSRRRWRRCTTSSKPARPATSARPRCGRGGLTRNRALRQGKAEFLNFLNHVARVYPRRSLHVVLDNYHTHKHDDINQWLAEHPRITLHFTP